MLTPLDDLFGSMLPPPFGYFFSGFGLFGEYHQKDN